MKRLPGYIRSKHSWKTTAIDYAGIILGVTLVAVGLDVFLVPNRIAGGGVSGLAIILHYLLNVPVGTTILALNIPLFYAGIKLLGAGFGLRTLVATVVLSAEVDLFAAFLPVITHDLLLAAIYGGLLTGIGMGMVFRFRGTTGGTDMIARLVHRFTSFTIGQALLIVDFFIIAAAGVVFNAELALFALINLYINIRIIDLVQEGISVSKMAVIISDYSEDIAAGILGDLGRGVTGLDGEGLYSGRKRQVLLCVINRAETGKLKDIVNSIDPAAFVIMTDTHEVLGEGFKRYQTF
ncbi:MAG: YitT family protein [bacterium]|nr:YitT family protein [bacterium]